MREDVGIAKTGNLGGGKDIRKKMDGSEFPLLPVGTSKDKTMTSLETIHGIFYLPVGFSQAGTIRKGGVLSVHCSTTL